MRHFGIWMIFKQYEFVFEENLWHEYLLGKKLEY